LKATKPAPRRKAIEQHIVDIRDALELAHHHIATDHKQPYELAYRKAFRALDRLVVAIHVNK
jgi:hypothetical protein